MKVWISLIPNLGIKKYKILIQKFRSKENLFRASKNDLKSIVGIGEKLAEFISNKTLKEYVYKHINYMNQHKIDIISLEDKEYPKLLKEIENPPLNIYIIGNKEILNHVSIGIVGCRESSEYGREIAESFAYQLSKDGLIVVSGLARGIDSLAHFGAVKANKPTIAVLGNGLDTIYPKENLKLANDIIKNGGALISEYPLGVRTR